MSGAIQGWPRSLPASWLLLLVDYHVVGLDAFGLRIMAGLRARLPVSRENHSDHTCDLAVLLVSDLECRVIDLFQCGCIAGLRSFDRIVFSVKLPAPLIVRGLAFRI